MHLDVVFLFDMGVVMHLGNESFLQYCLWSKYCRVCCYAESLGFGECI